MSEGLIGLIKTLLGGVEGPERAEFLASLYSDEAVVVSVFSRIGPLERALLFKMLLIDRAVNESLVLHWGSELKPAMARLAALGIFVLGPNVELNSTFRATLVATIHNLGHNSSIFASGKFAVKPSSKSSTWHAVLERVITSATLSSMSLRDIDRVTLRLGFGVAPTPPAAYTFVLASTTEQLWTLLGEFVAIVDSQRGGGGLVAASVVLKIVCGLDRCVSLRADVGNMELCMRTILFLEDLDVIRKTNETMFCLGSTGPSLLWGQEQQAVGAKLLVDSNMHLTAYTQSGLQVKLVSLFCQVQRVIGNVLVGILTRASVQKAIDAGVSANGIIAFLTDNLHPAANELPKNVSLQIKLWESDCPRNRLLIEPVTIFSWRGDRNEQASRAIGQVKALAESHRGLLFVKHEPDGRVYLGVKTEVAKAIANS